MDSTILYKVGYKARSDGKTIEDLGPEDFSDLLPFTDKASYLVWAAEWKKDYQRLSTTIRDKKVACKQLQREGNPDASTMQAFLEKMGWEARLMVAQRRASKQRSWALREQSRQEIAV